MGVSDFNEMEIDAIGEIMNISFGASATAVSTMLGTKVNITTPMVRVLTKEEFDFKKLQPAIGVEIAYVEGLQGSNVMMFCRNDVRIIVGMLMGAEVPPEQFELDELSVSAICEVMNQMMGSSATALSEFFGYAVNISTPVSFPVESEDDFKEKYFPQDVKMVVVHFLLEIEGKLESEFLNIMPVELAEHLIEPFAASLRGSIEEKSQVTEPEPAPEPVLITQPEPIPVPAPQPVPEPQPMPAPQPVPEPQPMPAPQPVPEPQPMPAPQPVPQPESMPAPQPVPVPQPMSAVQPVMMGQPVYQAAPMDPVMLQLLTQMQQSQMQMMELMHGMREKEKSSGSGNGNGNIIHPVNTASLDDSHSGGEEDKVNQEMLMKVPLEISVEIGRTKKLVKDILELTQGSLVVLDKMAGEPADLYVNGRCVARGDIVVVEDNFGIRITDIIARNLNPEIL